MATEITFEHFEESIITRIRARTISMKRMSKREIARVGALYPVEDHGRPQNRSECVDGERPCPFVSCKYHLYLDFSPETGSIKLNFPHLEVWEIPESCSLDAADRGDLTLDEIGVLVNLTRERVRQIEVVAFEKFSANLPTNFSLLDLCEPAPQPNNPTQQDI